MHSLLNADSALEAEAAVPLSRGQEQVWLAQSLVPEIPLYNLAVSYTFKAQLNPERFVQSLDLLFAATDVLQSQVFVSDKEVPMQRKQPALAPDCPQFAFETRDELEAWMHRRCRIALIPTDRLIDCALLAGPEGQHTFYWCQHHLISDGFNIELIINALSDIYSRLSSGESASEIAPTLQMPAYFDFVAREQAAANSERALAVADHWQEKAALEHDAAEFFGKAFDNSHAKTRMVLNLSSRQREGIEELLKLSGFRSLSRDMSLFVLMATAMLVTGLRLHGKTSVNLGFPSQARKNELDRHTPGMFTGIGFLHLDLHHQDTFTSVARKVMRQVVESFAFIEPGIQTKTSQAAYSTSVNVLSANIRQFAGLPVSADWIYPGCSDSNSQLDLILTDFSGSGEFTLAFDMAESVFSNRERATYQESFLRTLDTMLDSPESLITRFSMVTDSARERLISDDQSLSYQALDEQADAIAAWLHANGVAAGDVVGVCFNRSIQMYPAIMGVLKAKAVYLPLDPSYPDERLSYMVNNSSASCILCNGESKAEFDIGTAIRIDIDQQSAQIADNWQRLSSEGFKPDDIEAVSDTLYIMYTSGSTGLPKGVVGTQAATLNRFEWMWKKYPFQPGEVCCQKTALNFVDSIWELFGALLQGMPTIVIPDETVLDVFAFVDVLEMQQVSRLVLVPSFLSVLLDSDADIGSRLRALEICIVSGEPLPRQLAASFLNRVGHCRLINLYGSTEVSADVTFDEVARDKLAIRMPIGRPIDGVQLYLLDDQMNLMVDGELNRQKFVPNPFQEGRMFRTGDLGRFNAAGLLEHHGRRDSQIKIRGHRIESAEIENTVLEHDGVKAAVLLVADNDRLYLFYVIAQDVVVEEASLIDHIQKKLPEYMMPSLVELRQLPLLGNGKINRAALKLMIKNEDSSTERNCEPRTPTEQVLVDLWKQTLGLHAVDVHADFFDLGGNSIAAMRIMVGARNAGFKLSRSGQGSDISLAKFDAEATVRQLVELSPSLGSMDRVSDTFHLTATQKGILFHLLLQGEEDPLYLAQVRCDFIGELDFDLFQTAWNQLAARHEVLRSVILHEGLHEPVQVIASENEIKLETHDLSHISDDDASHAAAHERNGGASGSRLASHFNGWLVPGCHFQRCIADVCRPEKRYRARIARTRQVQRPCHCAE